MQITFIDPPVLEGTKPPERVFGCTYGLYPIPNIFLLSTAAVLEKEKRHIKYINMPLENWEEEEFISFLEKDSSDIYCIYSVNLAKKNDLKACEIIRKYKEDIRIVFLGPAPTYNPEEYLFDEDVIVVRGEPELVLQSLAENLDNLPKVKGISYKKEGEVIHNKSEKIIENLDSLPFPARHLLEKNKYFNPKLGIKPFTAILTSRGCPYQCNYCVPCSLSFAREIEAKKKTGEKPPYRMRSAKNVIEEFRLLKEQGYKAISILDDEFLINKKRILEICDGIKDLGIKWGCLGRADNIDEETAKALSESDCVYVDVGVESFNQAILNDIKKNLKVETIETAIGLLKRYNIMAKINIMFGCSSLETKQTIEETICKIKKLDPDSVMFGICNPFPGTEYYKIAKEKDWFIHGDYVALDVQKGSNISYPHLSGRELELAVRKANWSFFMNPKFILKQLKRVNSFESIVGGLTALGRKLF